MQGLICLFLNLTISDFRRGSPREKSPEQAFGVIAASTCRTCLTAFRFCSNGQARNSAAPTVNVTRWIPHGGQ